MKRLCFNEQMARAWHEGRKTRTWKRMKWQDAEVMSQRHYSPGEIVFIAEPWAADPLDRESIIYKADWTDGCRYIGELIVSFKSPAIMPEWASRSKARIVSIKPQRVQDVTITEIYGEGCPIADEQGAAYWFTKIIDSIYPGAWNRNDWGWAIESEKLD